MAIYNIDGNALNGAYNVNGSSLVNAYDIDGEAVFPTGATSLKVMTYNWRWCQEFNSQQAMQTAIIQNNDADIIGFQEFSKNSSVPAVGANALSGYSTIKLSNHYNYNAMASKSLALSNVTIADFQTQDPYDISTYNETRCYMKCYLSIGGKTVCWINTHLCYHTDESQYAQMAEIFALAEQEDYCIITGDFNSTAVSVTDSDYINLFKPFVDAGYNLANSTAERGFTKTWSDSVSATSVSQMTDPCDNIIVSGNIDMHSVAFDTTKFSYLNGQSIDHIPVIVTLEIM